MVNPPRQLLATMKGLRPASTALLHTSGVIRLVWPQLLAVCLLLFVSATSLWLLSASRAYVGGESLWSKAQKEAVLHLLHFARTGEEVSHRRFRESIDVTLGDRQARLQLIRPEYDRELVAAGFVRGRNDPDD